MKGCMSGRLVGYTSRGHWTSADPPFENGGVCWKRLLEGIHYCVVFWRTIPAPIPRSKMESSAGKGCLKGSIIAPLFGDPSRRRCPGADPPFKNGGVCWKRLSEGIHYCAAFWRSIPAPLPRSKMEASAGKGCLKRSIIAPLFGDPPRRRCPLAAPPSTQLGRAHA